jgi:glycosyltransferase involved in cell wall biosynthesis
VEQLRVGVFNTQPPHLYFGGVERRIMEVAKRLRGKVNIRIYSGTKAGFTKPTYVNGALLIPCFSTDLFFPVDNWFFNWTLSRKINLKDCDVYESHTVSGYGILKLTRKRNTAKPLIETIHGVLADEYAQTVKGLFPTLRLKASRIFMKKLISAEKKLTQKADLIVTVSKYSLQKIVENYEVSRDKIIVVPSGVDVERFKPVSEPKKIEIKRRLGLSGRECVLYVGSLIPRKGLNYLLETAKQVVKEKINVTFVIVGEGPLRDYIMAYSKKAGLQENIKLLGKVSENFLPEMYNCADIFVSPSLQEGQGLTLLEAQASGIPVIAFSAGAVSENMLHNKTGILIKPSSEEMAEAVLRLLADKALRDKMGKEGRKFSVKNFSWKKCAERMLKVYRELV